MDYTDYSKATDTVYSEEAKALQKKVDDAIRESVRKRNIAIEGFLEEQTCKLFKEAIASGDFMSHCIKHADSSEGWAVTYEPYREKMRLEARIRELEAEICRLNFSPSSCPS